MRRFELLSNNKSFNSKEDGFTIVELILVTTIVGILAAVSVPSSLKWIYKEKQNAYVRELIGFIELMRKESRRWNGSCSLSPKRTKINDRTQQPLFNVSCKGMNNNQKNNISRSIPLADKFIFQEVSSPFNVTPKGHVSLSSSSSNNSSVVMIIGGRYAMQSSSERPKCILIESPSGIIRSGIYSSYNSTSSGGYSSKINPGLRTAQCIIR
tara:strand:- start:446 stop:1078 length:633 start_codon:yes stop_codon:yes gene_type:complete